MNREDIVAIREHCFYRVPQLFRAFNESLPRDDQRLGGFFCLLGVWQPETPILIQQVGEQERQRRINSSGYCQEKAQRLAAHPDHFSSWMSRNEAAEQYGGAIRWGEYIFSFSGLPELADEAMMLALLQRERWPFFRRLQGLPKAEYIQQIANQSGSNQYLSLAA